MRKITFSQPSGGNRAKNLLIRGDASVPADDEAFSSGEVLWLSSGVAKQKNKRIEKFVWLTKL